MGAAALFLDPGGEFLEKVDMAGRHRNACAGLRQRLGKAPTQPAGGPGNESGFPFEA